MKKHNSGFQAGQRHYAQQHMEVHPIPTRHVMDMQEADIREQDAVLQQKSDDDFYDMLESITDDYLTEYKQERRSFISIIVNVIFN